VRAIIVGAHRHASEVPAAPDADGPAGRVARYAWRDHYTELRRALGEVAAALRTAGHRAVVLADDNAIVDREVAHRAGLGWFGKNANLLLPGRGSWFVLGSVLTTAPLPPAEQPVADGCGTCRRCLDGCPTGAIVAPGVVDARRCLAWLVQKPGSFPRPYRESLHDRIYGCDDCQEVCPPNLRAARHEPFAGAGAATADDADQAWVPLLDLLSVDDATLLARHGRWYLANREPRWLRRNALLALGNVADPGDRMVAGTLARYVAHEDPMLRAHAVWAARRLGRVDLLTTLVGETDPDVLDELAADGPPPRSSSVAGGAGRR
jgi:epoxyqueuosine reductase